MSRSLRSITILLLLAAHAARAEDLIDRVDEALTFSAFDDNVRMRFSGLFDLEYYHFTQPAPGLLFTEDHDFLNPRLTLFFDAQVGSSVYAFAQTRLDRGFDPGDGSTGMRLEEYAVRFTPWDDGRFSLQAGRFATVVGNWNERHLSWENPFINAPLVYENVTGIYDAEGPPSAGDFAEGIVEEKYDYNPVIWGPSYATGLSVSGKLGEFDYAAEIKNASLSSRPESWDATEIGFDHPTVSARVGWRPNMAWKLGFSASEGSYFTPAASPTLPDGAGIGDYKQQVLGQDISFAWHHWQFWAEVYEARFQVPHVGDANTTAYYLEAKYKFTPRLFGALRWNQQFFGDVPDGKGGEQPWGHDIWRVDAALTCRFTPHTQTKLQYSLQHADGAEHDFGHLIAVQFTLKF